MADAKRDNNQVPVMMGTLDTDGVTPILIKVDATSKAVSVSDGVSVISQTRTIAPRDNNGVPVMMGVSNADGTTLIPIYADSNGNILTKST